MKLTLALPAMLRITIMIPETLDLIDTAYKNIKYKKLKILYDVI